ncbi:hypothetical protein B0H19DRAFT_1270905 [Mycena capillaripes]|nr:hypothetical protein B0H19DRAFT_1270905 [Mycena capillaripes]
MSSGADVIEDKGQKKARTDVKADKDRKKAATDLAKKHTELGAINRPFDDLVDDPSPSPPTTAVAAQGRPKTGLSLVRFSRVGGFGLVGK